MSHNESNNDRSDLVYLLPVVAATGAYFIGRELQPSKLNISTEQFLSGAINLAENNSIAETNVSVMCSNAGGIIEWISCVADKANEGLMLWDQVGMVAQNKTHYLLNIFQNVESYLNNDVLIGLGIALAMATISIMTTASRH